MTTRPPLTTNHYAGTRDIAAHRRAVLDAFVALHDVDPRAWMTRREAQVRAYGTDKAGASSAASAVGWLLNLGLLRRHGSTHYMVTELGLTAHTLALALDDADEVTVIAGRGAGKAAVAEALAGMAILTPEAMVRVVAP